MTASPGPDRNGGRAGSPAAVFDLDGTLLDTLPDLHGSLNRTLAAAGLPAHTLAECRAMVGNGLSRLVRDAVPEDLRGDAARLESLRRAFRKDYTAHQLELTRPYPGIPELLEALSALGWPMAVLSNKDHGNTLAVTGHFFPGAFKAVLGVAESRPPKPDPQGAREAAAILGRQGRDVFYIGDSENDMRTAAVCGFTRVGAGWGFRTREALLAAGAEAVLDSPLDFLGIWEGL
ncbi:MAG: HAD family hydrolase [Deltaproteobacteria bacterium]|jgi:phosphoglycolate phosphatase|nr:HAD family hydrolase [Deltaproteobacteria bacterium]